MNNYFVYCHTDYDNFDNPLYIGIGNSRKRAYEQKGRDGTHRVWLESVPHDYDYVEILESGLSKFEAEKAETRLIRELDTRFNIQKRIR